MESKIIYYSRFFLFGIPCTATAGFVTIFLLRNNMQMDIIGSTFWLFVFKDFVIFHVLQLFFLLSYIQHAWQPQSAVLGIKRCK